MARFNVMRIAINDHHQMYDEIVEVIAHSLTDLGHDCSVTLNDYQPGAVNILVGASIFASRHFELPQRLRGLPYFVYQVEQLDDAHGLLAQWPEYQELLGNASCIWDYAPSSTRYLQTHGFARVTYLPPGYHSCLSSFPQVPEAPIDIAFCGTPHPRRQRILTAFQDAGLKVAFAANVYGAQRNLLLASTKITLNIHAWDDLNILETVRLSLLLANRRFVISERGDHNPYDDGLIYADYELLVTTCVDYLGKPPDVRNEIAGRGYRAIREIDMTGLIGAILPQSLANLG